MSGTTIHFPLAGNSAMAINRIRSFGASPSIWQAALSLINENARAELTARGVTSVKDAQEKMVQLGNARLTVHDAIMSILTQEVHAAVRMISGQERKGEPYSVFTLSLLHEAQRYVQGGARQQGVGFVTGLSYRLKYVGIRSSEALWAFLEQPVEHTAATLYLREARCNELLGWFLQSINLPLPVEGVSERTETPSSDPSVLHDAFSMLSVLHNLSKAEVSASMLPRTTMARNSVTLLSALPEAGRPGLLYAIANSSQALKQWWSGVSDGSSWPDFSGKSSVFLSSRPGYSRDVAIEFYDVLMSHFNLTTATCIEQVRGLTDASECSNDQQVFPNTSAGLPWLDQQKVDQALFEDLKWQAMQDSWPVDRTCALDAYFYCGDKSVTHKVIYSSLLCGAEKTLCRHSDVFSQYLQQTKKHIDTTVDLPVELFRSLYLTSCTNLNQTQNWTVLLNDLQSEFVFQPWLLNGAWWLIPAPKQNYQSKGKRTCWTALQRYWETALWHKDSDRFSALMDNVADYLGDTPVSHAFVSLLRTARHVEIAQVEPEEPVFSMTLQAFVSVEKRNMLLKQAIAIALVKLGDMPVSKLKNVIGRVIESVNLTSTTTFLSYLLEQVDLFEWQGDLVVVDNGHIRIKAISHSDLAVA